MEYNSDLYDILLERMKKGFKKAKLKKSQEEILIRLFKRKKLPIFDLVSMEEKVAINNLFELIFLDSFEEIKKLNDFDDTENYLEFFD